MIEYNRKKAVEYTLRWARGRNPAYYNFETLGGDCTNFASQTLYAGAGIMNYIPTWGWYYINLNNRAPAWAGVNELYRFLTRNEGRGPFAREVEYSIMQSGDLIQLRFEGEPLFGHTLIMVSGDYPKSMDEILVASHSIDRLAVSLTDIKFETARFIHILGVSE